MAWSRLVLFSEELARFSFPSRFHAAALLRPRTRGWDRNRAALEEYVEEQDAKHRKALGIGAQTGD